MSVEADVGIRRDDGCHCDGRTEVCERLDGLAVPRDGDRAEYPYKVRNEEDDRRLVQAVEHVHPELELRVLEPTDAANVELGEREGGLGVEILVEGCEDWSARVRGHRQVNSPPSTMTGNEVKTRL